MTIFVSIAAYRDPELVPTIRDCLHRAHYPSDLRFGICWQHGADETEPPDFADGRMRVIDVPWHASRGACWARAEIMRLWDGEDFYLQLDSHHRFVQDWDALLITHAARTGAAKPLLTTYPAPFDPAAAELPPGEPMLMGFDHFSADGIPAFHPRVIPDWPTMQRPLRARFVAGGFVFTLGAFVHEVPYDPELYFHGEEIMLSIRAFTHGYDLFHPPEHILWHEYSRPHRAKHWGDHVQAQGIAVEWHERDAISREKVQQFLLEPYVGPFGCGSERGFAEYEAYAGLSFLHRRVQDATLRGEEPPNPPPLRDGPMRSLQWQVRIVLDRAALSPAALVDPQFWYVGFHDANNAEVHREDANPEELRYLLAGDSAQIVIERQFRSACQPATWTVWPFSCSEEWLEKTVGIVDSSNLLVVLWRRDGFANTLSASGSSDQDPWARTDNRSARIWNSAPASARGRRRAGKVTNPMSDLQSVFTGIYQHNGFGGSESISGPGSSVASTAKLRAELPATFLSFGIKRIIDAPCGDMNWMRHLDYQFEFFIGVDIVQDLVECLRLQFPSDRYHFQVGDICKDILPAGDAIFCRDCLGHLPFSKISEATRLFKLSGARFLLATTFPEWENVDVPAGGWRAVNLQAAPLLWPNPMTLIRENFYDPRDLWNEKSIGVWSVVSLPD